jgi:hypothetical protein
MPQNQWFSQVLIAARFCAGKFWRNELCQSQSFFGTLGTMKKALREKSRGAF